MASITDQEIQQVVQSFGGRSFSTYDFILGLQKAFIKTWKRLEREYGAGGKGAGTQFSAFSRVAHSLNSVANRGWLTKLDYRTAPAGWGSPVIRYWTVSLDVPDFPEEVPNSTKVVEGAKKEVVVNKYERDPSARLKCIEKWGIKCAICNFDFEEKYGSRGAGYIHVHHLKPLSEIGEEYELDPAADLRPVCPNCHAMIHRSIPAIGIEEMKQLCLAVDEE